MKDFSIQAKLICTVFAACIILTSCGGSSSNKKPVGPLNNRPQTPMPVTSPVRESEKIERGQKIFQETIKRSGFDYRKPIVSGMCVDVVIPFPRPAWNKLSKKDKVDLALFAQDTIRQVKSKPADYIEMPATAPLYSTCLQNIAKLCEACWRIEAGSVVTIDGDTNIGPDAEVVVDGKSMTEFLRSNEK